MFRRSAFVLAVATFAVASAWAEGPIDTSRPSTSSLSRGEVRADYAQFRKTPSPWSSSYNMFRSPNRELTRSQVTGEYRASREAANALNGEDSGSAYRPRMQRRGSGQVASYDPTAN